MHPDPYRAPTSPSAPPPSDSRYEGWVLLGLGLTLTLLLAGVAAVNKVPTDAWGNELRYVVSAEGPLLISLGGDRALGGEGVDGDLIRVVGGSEEWAP